MGNIGGFDGYSVWFVYDICKWGFGIFCLVIMYKYCVGNMFF